MTGMDAWSLVAPILASYIGPRKKGQTELDPMGEAYVLVYCALLEHDKKTSRELQKEESQ